MTASIRPSTPAATLPLGWRREEIAGFVARDIPPGSYVNLGIGIPTLVANYTLDSEEVIFHSENGLLGMGPPPPDGEVDLDLINASKELVTLVDGGAYMNHAESFALIRGGHLDLAVLGSFEVAANGDLANWSGGDAFAPAVGGAMDLAAGARAIWVAMTHRTRDGRSKCLSSCTLPLTARGVVERVYTDLAILSVDKEHNEFVIEALAPGWTIEKLQGVTGGRLRGVSGL